MPASMQIHQVEKRFGSGAATIFALNPIDLDVQPGEFVSIVGPSGCGKSTLLRLLGGLETPTSGRVALNGDAVERTDPRCSIMFQEPRLFPWKRVAANVAVGTRRSQQKASPDLWLDKVGLPGFRDSYPHQLSGGMAQRVALARALIGNPQVLLLDEPFGALDALTRMQMQDLLAGVCEDIGTTVVMVTHDIDEALYLANRVVIMSHRPGTIVEIVAVPSKRPRDRSDPAIARLRPNILRHFGFEESCTESVVAVDSFAAD